MLNLPKISLFRELWKQDRHSYQRINRLSQPCDQLLIVIRNDLQHAVLDFDAWLQFFDFLRFSAACVTQRVPDLPPIGVRTYRRRNLVVKLAKCCAGAIKRNDRAFRPI